MTSPRRSRGCLLFAVPCAGLVCLVAAALVLGGTASLGAPSDALGPVEQALLAAYLVINRSALTGPAGSIEAETLLDIEPGQDAATVAAELESLGIVDRPELLSRYLRYRGLDTQIEAGRFQVSGTMSIQELAELLQQARASRYSITVREGWRREEIAEALGELGLGFSAADFLEATRRAPPGWAEAPPAMESLEGFLFPDTYQLDPAMSAQEVVDLMVEDLEAHLSQELLAGFAAQGLTPLEALTLASIVEREAILPSERTLIASVFLNRLGLGIPLQADPTVQYALGRGPEGWWKPSLSAADLQIDDPFNTYLQDGLPPGPIANPGLASIESVAAPADTGYLFFRAVCDGSGAHVFAVTFEEHVANACD